MKVYKKILSTALAASMTLSAVPVTAVSEAGGITATPTAVEETAEAVLPPAEENEEQEQATEETEESSEENSEEQTEEQNEEITEQVEVQDLREDEDDGEETHVGSLDSTGRFYITDDGYITEFVKGGDVVVPKELKVGEKTITVTGVKSTNTDHYSCMTGADQVTSLDLSACTELEEIGEYAFKGCSKLEKVIFPTGKGVSYTIGTFAFMQTSENITGIKGDIDLSGCTSIVDGAFEACAGITEVNLKNCKSIGKSAFSFCYKLTDIVWSDTLTVIPPYCFANCENLNSFNNGNDFSNITEINYGAFRQCGKLAGTVDLTNCTSIEWDAFYGCTDLKPIISADIEEVQWMAFGYEFGQYEYNTDDDDYDEITYSLGDDETIDTRVPYVTIVADSEEDLKELCENIIHFEEVGKQEDTLSGLADVKKVAVLKDSGVNIAYANDIDKVVNLNADNTYYISATPKDNYKLSGYNTVSAYNILLETITNGTAKTATLSAEAAENLPVSFTIDEYDSAKNYYLSTDLNSTPTVNLTFNKNAAGTYTSSATNVSVAAAGSDIAVVSSPEYNPGGDNGGNGDGSGDNTNGGNGDGGDQSGANGQDGTNNGNPTTGDSAGLLAALGAGMAALGLGGLSLKKKKKEEE